MAKPPGSDGAAVTLASPAAPGDGEPGEDCPEEEDISLEEILTLYGQPLNEEQAWAVCYQCCLFFNQFKPKRRNSQTRLNRESAGEKTARKIEGPRDVRIGKDGTIKLHPRTSTDKPTPTSPTEVIESLGIMIYKALDFGLKADEERELSPPLERLIDLMTDVNATETDACPDEGYEATEEEDDGEEDQTDAMRKAGYRNILTLCASHLPDSSDAPNHYQAVCRALYTETKELRFFLEKIKNAKANLQRIEEDTSSEPVRDLTELQNADWAQFWSQVMKDLRTGVKLKKVQERQYNPMPIEYQLTPYEMLMEDIRVKRYTLRKVMVDGNIPPKLKKSAHETILEFIRSRPPLKPVSARKLKPHPPRPLSLHERILEEIKTERKLKPVSPDMIRRNRLGSTTPDTRKKIAVSMLALSEDPTPPQSPANGGPPLSQRKKLKAPTLADLDSSDSEEEITSPHRSISTPGLSSFVVGESCTEGAVAKRTPPNFLPLPTTKQLERQLAVQRRHSIEKEAPMSVRSFAPISRQISRSLLPVENKEEFSFPVECLSLTVEEVMHIRQVLVKADLEKYQHYKEIYTALKKGKLCCCCRTRKFSIFTWSYTCQFCKRPVCSQCCKKTKLPSKPYAKMPIYSLGPASLPQKQATAPVEKHSPYQRHQSLNASTSRTMKPTEFEKQVELPKELTADWSTMDVCVDCQKFISDIVNSSKRSLSVASTRARMKRKTQSFYLSPSRARDYRPSEKTINEV